MIETVLFDLDDTICEYRRSGAEVLDAAFARAGVEPFFTVADYYVLFDDFLPGSESIRDHRERCFAEIAADAGFDRERGTAVARAYAEERDHRNVRFRPGAPEALARLGEDHRLGIVTNGGPRMQAAKLDALGLADVFEVVVHAGYDTRAKPDPEPFHHALSSLSSTPDRAVHVGNSLRSDVAGAHAAGLTSVWVPDGDADQDPNPDPAPHYVVGSLHDMQEPPWR